MSDLNQPTRESPFKGNSGIKRVYRAFINSWSGLILAIRHESAFRQELTLTVILFPLGLWLPVNALERILLLGSVVLVLIIELLNSSVEAAIDRISLERHQLSKRAKDLGSAAVLLALILCAYTWLSLAGPHLLKLFS
jgi:diacylglycerol kinase (ATP)